MPELQQRLVNELGWLTAQQFADAFIAQVAPGPSTLLVTLLGYRVAGLAGAAAATAAMVLPATLLVWFVARSWVRTGHARWHVALEHGLVPVGVGLVAASGAIIARGIDTTLAGWVITLGAASALIWTRLNPFSVVMAGGAVGLLLGGV